MILVTVPFLKLHRTLMSQWFIAIQPRKFIGTLICRLSSDYKSEETFANPSELRKVLNWNEHFLNTGYSEGCNPMRSFEPQWVPVSPQWARFFYKWSRWAPISTRLNPIVFSVSYFKLWVQTYSDCELFEDDMSTGWVSTRKDPKTLANFHIIQPNRFLSVYNVI